MRDDTEKFYASIAEMEEILTCAHFNAFSRHKNFILKQKLFNASFIFLRTWSNKALVRMDWTSQLSYGTR